MAWRGACVHVLRSSRTSHHAQHACGALRRIVAHAALRMVAHDGAWWRMTAHGGAWRRMTAHAAQRMVAHGGA
eukprot:351599-Chlamydomonas_euryale.AAC.4